jgi:hypothetical protein
MNFWDIAKNPVIIGLFAGVLTFVYMEWKNRKDYKKSKNKNKNKKKKEVNLLIPLGVIIVFWFIAHAYLTSDTGDTTSVSMIDAKDQIKRDLSRDLTADQVPKYKFKKGMSDTSEPLSFNLVSGGIQIPNQLPDILFEVK